MIARMCNGVFVSVRLFL